MRLFGSIEDRAGVNDPDYEPPSDAFPEPVENADEDDHKATGLELFGAFIFPIFGPGPP